MLEYDEFWEGIGRLFGDSKIISCSEPIVNALIGNKTLDGGAPCGKKSIRIHPDQNIVGCVYYKHSVCDIDNLIEKKKTLSEDEFIKFLEQFEKETRIIPEECKDCDQVDVCKGGCASRRWYIDLKKPDMYCWKIRNLDPPQIKYEWGKSKDLVHSEYLCTIIVE